MYFLLLFYIVGFLVYLNFNGVYKKADHIVDKFKNNSFDDRIISEKGRYQNKVKGFEKLE